MTEMVDCEAVRSRLSQDPSSLEPGLRDGCERHVAECAECREYLALDPLLLRAYERLRDQKAPEALHEEVLANLRDQDEGQGVVALHDRTPTGQGARVHRGSWTKAGWSVAVTLVAASLAVVALTRGPGDGDATGAAPGGDSAATAGYVEDFLRYASPGEHLATTDPTEVAAFLRSRLDISVAPIEAEGLELEGAEVCILDGLRGALILYKLHGEVISHYLIPRDDASPRTAAPQPLQYPARPEWGARARMVTWASPRLEQALVGSVQVSDMVRLAGSGIS